MSCPSFRPSSINPWCKNTGPDTALSQSLWVLSPCVTAGRSLCLSVVLAQSVSCTPFICLVNRCSLLPSEHSDTSGACLIWFPAVISWDIPGHMLELLAEAAVRTRVGESQILLSKQGCQGLRMPHLGMNREMRLLGDEEDWVLSPLGNQPHPLLYGLVTALCLLNMHPLINCFPTIV